MSIHRRCTEAMNLVMSELAVLELSVVVLECGWHRFRDDPNRLSFDLATQEIYIKGLHEWYTVDNPRDRAGVLDRINGFWDRGSGKAWRKLATKLLPKLVGETIQGLRPQINQCNEEWASLQQRCNATGEVWEELDQLEFENCTHRYFVGERRGRLRYPPMDESEFNELMMPVPLIMLSNLTNA